MSREHVQAMGDLLRRYATHFADEDWRYTRDLGSLESLRYGDGRDSLRTRIGMAIRSMLRRPTELESIIRVPRWRIATSHLRRRRHLPDGQLDDGCILTVWEEQGEYIQLVQPSVGEIVAQIMIDHPDLPLVQALAGEIDRINERYARRILGAAAEASP